jgi:hypothetical protein
MQLTFGVGLDKELGKLLLDIVDEYNARESEDKLDLIKCIRESAL